MMFITIISSAQNLNSEYCKRCLQGALPQTSVKVFNYPNPEPEEIPAKDADLNNHLYDARGGWK